MPNDYRATHAHLRVLRCLRLTALPLITLPAIGHSQQPSSNVLPGPNGSVPANGSFVGTFVDAYSGKQFDRYLEQENVPVPRWEQQEVSERRLVPQWVTEAMKTTETRYLPYVEYQPRQRVINAWNPFARPQAVVEYVPVTRYQAVNQVVERPVTYQKYVEQDVKVLVPKLVQTTEARMKYVDRERTSTNSQTASNSNSIQNAADLAMAQRNQAARYETRPMDPWYNATPTAIYPYSPYAYAHPNPPMPPTNAFAAAPPNAYAAASTMRWPSWTSSQGPLFQQQFVSRNPTMAYGQPTVGSIYYPIASNAGVTGMLRPSTSPMLPASSSNPSGGNANMIPYRDPTQSGIPATVLR